VTRGGRVGSNNQSRVILPNPLFGRTDPFAPVIRPKRRSHTVIKAVPHGGRLVINNSHPTHVALVKVILHMVVIKAVSHAQEWCCDSWCYVNPLTCNATVWYTSPHPSFRALYGRLKFTVIRHKFNKDSSP